MTVVETRARLLDFCDAQITEGLQCHERYVERFGHEPECYAASAYDTTGVILQAIEGVGRADRAAITQAAFAIRDFDGVLGRRSFDANGDIDLRRGTRLIVQSGHFEPLAVQSIGGSPMHRLTRALDRRTKVTDR